MLQILIDRLDLGATLPEAIAAARATQRDTSATLAEGGFLAAPGATALVASGHARAPTG